jgi:hypothetical protein
VTGCTLTTSSPPSAAPGPARRQRPLRPG